MTSIKDDGTVEFRFYRPGAGRVLLAGDFSQWAKDPVSMSRDGNGWWAATLKLVAGDYRFRYIADGNWFTDFASHGIEVCREGWNSVLLVPEEITSGDSKPSGSARENTTARSAA